MKRALLVQPSLQPPGGGNGVAVWMLEALRERYRLATFTWSPLDVEEINRFYGTALAAGAIEANSVPAIVRIPIDAIPMRLALLKSSLLMRMARRRMAHDDVVLSANNEIDFGQLGIQYVHDPTYLRPPPRADGHWYHVEWMLDGYRRFCDWIASFSADRMAANLTLVNSDWTAGRFRSRHGGNPRRLYPPVTGRFPGVPWADRRNDFLCIGRFSPEKDPDAVIEIVRAVRRVHPDVRLRFIGSLGPWRYSRRMLARIRREDWISVHLDLPHDDVRRLIASSRYGLHAMHNEHFGMAPAEVATGGCLVWVRDDGGPPEIVGDERLRFQSADEAVVKILRTMADPAEQAALRAVLAARTPAFTVDRFIEGVRAAADEMAQRQTQ